MLPDFSVLDVCSMSACANAALLLAARNACVMSTASDENRIILRQTWGIHRIKAKQSFVAHMCLCNA